VTEREGNRPDRVFPSRSASLSLQIRGDSRFLAYGITAKQGTSAPSGTTVNVVAAI
jgi:hypothetical protein